MNQAEKYESYWVMDSKVDVKGVLQPVISVTGHNSSMMTGNIVDQNGTILTFYGKESRVMIRWGYDNGFASKWSIGATPVNGSFIIAMPYGYEHADFCRIYINGNDYLIQPSLDGSNVYNYSDTTIWVYENYFKIKSLEADPDENWYVYEGQIPVHVNSASLTYRLSDN